MINVLKWIGFIFMWFVVYGCIIIVITTMLSLLDVELSVWVVSLVGIIWTSLIADDLAYICKI